MNYLAKLRTEPEETLNPGPYQIHVISPRNAAPWIRFSIDCVLSKVIAACQALKEGDVLMG